MVPINSTNGSVRDPRLLDALTSGNSSTRLKAALMIGTNPDPAVVEVLVARCGVEPDFFVRDMLTWALTRLPPEITVPKLRAELGSARAQARSQALHTLSKIGDRTAWPSITPALLRDADDEVARTAWRTAAALVPDEEKPALAAELATQFGRGDRRIRLSLSCAIAALGAVIEPILRTAMTHPDPIVRAHARATQRLLRDPDARFDVIVNEPAVVPGPGQEETTAC